MFGKYKHTVDEKGRLFVPSKMRDELGNTFYVTLGLDHCLSVYTEAGWQAILDKYNALPIVQARKMRFLFANAAKCEPDKQGRFLIPAELRQYAGLSNEVTLHRPGRPRGDLGQRSLRRAGASDPYTGESGCCDGGTWLLMEFAHQSVLLNECIDALAIKPDGIYLDGTLGGAGHSLADLPEPHHRQAHRRRPRSGRAGGRKKAAVPSREKSDAGTR